MNMGTSAQASHLTSREELRSTYQEFHMAFLSTFVSGAAPGSSITPLRAKLHQLGERWRHAAKQRKQVRQTMRELSAYSDRELADLGLSRADISGVANGTFPG